MGGSPLFTIACNPPSHLRLHWPSPHCTMQCLCPSCLMNFLLYNCICLNESTHVRNRLLYFHVQGGTSCFLLVGRVGSELRAGAPSPRTSRAANRYDSSSEEEEEEREDAGSALAATMRSASLLSARGRAALSADLMQVRLSY